jgi:hypothetical protein
VPDTNIHEAETLATPASQRTVAPIPKLQTVGEYRLIRELGQGGMGSVFEAEHIESGRRVALKLLSSRLPRTEETVERFIREARLSASLSHQRSTFIYGAGFHHDQPYIVMELMPGRNLKDICDEEGALPVARAVDYMLDVIEGLEAAHALGIVHRDVKPSNCFLDTSGRVKVGDFGLAKSLVNDATLTRTGAFMGTPQYAAPEQVRGGQVDARTDVYSVGATLFALIAGRAPFEGDAVAVIAKIVSDPAPSLLSVRPDVPKLLSRIIAKSLEKEPDKRFRNLRELRYALMPFATAGTSMATIGRRVAAYMVDSIVAGLIAGILVFACVVGWMIWANVAGDEIFLAVQMRLQAWAQLGMQIGIGLYFAISEGLWGRGVGKLLMGLRVTDLQGQRPGLFRTLLRSAFLPAGLGLSVAGTLYMLAAKNAPAPTSPWSGNQSVISVFLGLLSYLGPAVCSLTMRARNGYRGIHEFVSGTRVVRHRGSGAGRRWTVPVIAPVSLRAPHRLGPYQVAGDLGHSEGRHVWLAQDQVLRRTVWIYASTGQQEQPSGRRVSVVRPTRQHWLQGGTAPATDATSAPAGTSGDGPVRWDAYEAVLGAPLLVAAVHIRGFGWVNGRSLLLDLAEELAAAIDDETLPPALSLQQVWVDRGGRVKLLDAPLAASFSHAPGTSSSSAAGGDGSGENVPAPQPPRFDPSSVGPVVSPFAAGFGSQQAAAERAIRLLAEAANLVTRGQMLPVHAQEFVNGLKNRPPTRASLDLSIEHLRATADHSPRLGWDDRLGVLCVSMGLELNAYMWFMFLVVAVLSNVPGLRTQAEILIPAALTPLLALAVGYCFRGGPVFRLLGVEVCLADGRPAGRWRCAGRNFLAWFPFVSPYSAFAWVLVNSVLQKQPNAGMNDPAEFAVIVPLMCGSECVLVFFFIGGLWAIVQPQRGLQDLFAGTWLVPK